MIGYSLFSAGLLVLACAPAFSATAPAALVVSTAQTAVAAISQPPAPHKKPPPDAKDETPPASLSGSTKARSAPPSLVKSEPVTFEVVVEKARALAAKPYAAPDSPPPDIFARLGYDGYRNIRFKEDAADWRDTPAPFHALYLPRGFLFNDPIKVNIVENGVARPRPYRADEFDFDKLAPSPEDAAKLGFSGVRLTAPYVEAGKFDEFLVFQGATYFRGLGAEERYGASARGLSIDTASASGEEFPAFREFWIEKPGAGSESIVVWALMDSPRAAGAFRFETRPGPATVTDVDAVFFPRARLDRVGIAPITSMFYFGPQDHAGVDDFRPAVHDSDGLMIRSRSGEWIWRPLANPASLQISGFTSDAPYGFGLMQRARTFAAYQDLEARYELRPSVWVSPESNWGPGQVVLVEIPTDSEVNDNIVAFWRPDNAWEPGKSYRYKYAIHWGADAPMRPPLARVETTRAGRHAGSALRHFVLDFDGAAATSLKNLTADVSASAGSIRNVVVQPNEASGGVRLSFELDPGGAQLSELRARLMEAGRPASETWLFRWTRS